jgi:CheY-like chemotaxis protein
MASQTAVSGLFSFANRRTITNRLSQKLAFRGDGFIVDMGETFAEYPLCDSQAEYMRVLLVEDHADSRSVLEILLNRCGYRTVPAKSLKEARAWLQEMPFDILITDLNLPDGDGLDLMREAKRTHKLKAIAVTGRTSDKERDRGLKAGADYYLTKPIDYQQLKKVLCFP